MADCNAIRKAIGFQMLSHLITPNVASGQYDSGRFHNNYLEIICQQ